MACKRDIYKLLDSFCNKGIKKNHYTCYNRNTVYDGANSMDIDLDTFEITLMCFKHLDVSICEEYKLKGSFKKEELVYLKRSLMAAKKLWLTINEEKDIEKLPKIIKMAIKTFELENDFI